MDFNLILEILPYVVHQEGIALVDKLLVERIIHGISFNSVLQEEHGEVLDMEVACMPKSLWFSTFTGDSILWKSKKSL